MRLTGYAAIEFAEKHNLRLSKRGDRINESAGRLTVPEAEAIASEDEQLIYLDVPEADYYEEPYAGDDEVPAGATRRAADRALSRGHGPPGSGAGPRHATNDPGTPDETYEAVDSNDPLAEPPTDAPVPLELGPPYSGFAGGAVGGTPAEGRSKGGHIGHGIGSEASHPGDSTVGTEPTKARRRNRKQKKSI